MKKLLLTSVAGILAVSAAGAEIAPYVSVKGGYANQKNMLKVDSLPVELLQDVVPVIIPLELNGLPEFADMLDISFNTDGVWSFNPAFGIKFDFSDVKFAKFRLEAEYFRNAKAKKSASLHVAEWDDTESCFVDMGVSDFYYNYRNTGFLMNGYVDFETNSIVKPFVSAGVGYGRSKLSWGGTSTYVDGESVSLQDDLNDLLESFVPIKVPSSWSSDNLIWSVGAGLSFDVVAGLAIDAQYRYIDYGKVSVEIGGLDLADIEESAHQFMLGARYTF
ncbi:MAG: outer membrane beta-barrel protein [Alphaproteobacteria bacterium]|nr:outer membrane beta-barrel protein [Alphaproteobacteria bacterium]